MVVIRNTWKYSVNRVNNSNYPFRSNVCDLMYNYCHFVGSFKTEIDMVKIDLISNLEGEIF